MERHGDGAGGNAEPAFDSLKLTTGPVPIDPDVSPEYFELERERIFRRSWLCIGRLDELTSAGDYVVKDLPFLNTSLLVVRSTDGKLRAFHNICRHRGNKIVRSGGGQVRRFMCAFHGWSYDSEGQLVGVPDEDQFPGLRKAELGLVPVAIDVWEGFAFVNLQPQPKETLREWLGEIVDQYRGFFDDKPLVARYRCELNCGWKLVINAFAESYHAPILHQHTLSTSTANPQNPFAHPLMFEMFERHWRYSVFANVNHKQRPAEAFGALFYHAGGSDPNALPPGINPGRFKEWAFDLFFLFPNTVVLTGTTFYLPMYFTPQSWERTEVEFATYISKPRTAAEKINQELMKTLMRDVAREDFNTLEAMHAALKSQAMPTIELSRQEVLLRRLYDVVDRNVKRA